MDKKKAVIIGAGPAGLTAAYELLQRTNIKPVVYEMTEDIGGISKTINFKGNRIDIGGHRFFSKSDRVMKWWFNILPLQGAPSKDDIMLGRKIPLSKEPNAPDPEKTSCAMLIRNRLSRIFFLRKFFGYPIALNTKTVLNLGIARIIKIGISYLKTKIRPIRNETSLEAFLINRFGEELYNIFFKDYTEKVWGVPCREISAGWGAQRIKGLSISKAILHAIKQFFFKDTSIEQKNTETTLIEQFAYPKYGPGQMWEEVGKHIKKNGGEIHHCHQITGLEIENKKVVGVEVCDQKLEKKIFIRADFFFSTMPVKDLIFSIKNGVPDDVQSVAKGLVYRDFITVGLLLKKLKIKNETKHPTINNIVPDNWIYIQERDVRLGRLQIFNNWSPYLVKDSNRIWVGLEYFCNQDDELWSLSDDEFIKFAVKELASINIIDKIDVLDSTIIRIPKTYPAYFGSYSNFHVIQNYTDKFENLFLIGRNGMHKYNNQDHSMLTAMAAVDNIVSRKNTKENIWAVNTEEEYHEKN
jgi:protoporphyrinogen oxidase